MAVVRHRDAGLPRVPLPVLRELRPPAPGQHLSTLPEGWEWDETLFQGAAAHYDRGRLPYPSGLADGLASALGLDGRGRLLDVGCGPGTVALRLAHLFEEVVGLDADPEMLAVAGARAGDLGVANARWVRARGEDLPSAAPGPFRVATFAQSFHWMDRERVAAAVLGLLEPGGAFVHVDPLIHGDDNVGVGLPHPPPPADAITDLVRRWLGPDRRAGQGVLRHGTPGGEAAVLAAAGFDPPVRVRVDGGEPLVRTVDDVLAFVLSSSGSAPHLFGDRLPEFVADLRGLLAAASPSGAFSERTPDVDLVVYRPGGRS